MKKTRFTETQIVKALKEHEGAGCIGFAVKDYIWRQNENGPMIPRRKKETAPCAVNGAKPPLLN